MSDELPAGSVNVEDDGAESAAAAVAPVVAQPPAEPPAEPEQPKTVPLAALLAERNETKALKERLQQVEQWANQAKPYVDFVQANPQLMNRSEPATPTSTAPDPVDVQYARSLDLYTADGQPDVARAQTFRALVAQEARQIATSEVAPIRQQTAQDQSAMNFQRALQVKDGDGKTPEPETLRAVYSALGAQDTSNPQIAGLAVALALGLERMKPKAPTIAPPANPPVYTEASGGAVTVKPLSAFEQRMASERGRTPQQWQELSKGFEKGRSNVLED